MFVELFPGDRDPRLSLAGGTPSADGSAGGMSHILFVDDESRVLDGLRQGLRSKRKEWDVVFANGGPAALREIDKCQFDVVISDMQMPGMDGAELLSRVSVLQPQAVRIVLSGQMNEKGAARAANFAHRFLAKPCATEVLVETVTRALSLKLLLTSDRLRECVGGMGTLPSLPRACALLRQALSDESCSARAVAQIIREDIGVAAKVLQLVNSAFFGLSRKSSSIEQAVSYLGVDTLRSLVLANSLFTEFRGGNVALMARVQERSLLVGRVARDLLTDRAQAEVAATAGLLHDVGGLALACRLPDEWAANAALALSSGIELHQAERERLGVTHAGIGAYLLGLWGLPPEVIDAVAAQHEPWENLRTLDASSAVRVADVLVHQLLQPGLEPGRELVVPPEVVLRLGLTERLAKVYADTAQFLLSREGQRGQPA